MLADQVDDPRQVGPVDHDEDDLDGPVRTLFIALGSGGVKNRSAFLASAADHVPDLARGIEPPEVDTADPRLTPKGEADWKK
jgi:hypothetical protein